MYVAHVIKGISVTSSQLLFYPRIYQLHDILDQPQQPGTMTQSQTIALPTLVPDLTESIEESGAYLIFNGDSLALYVGRFIDEGFASQVTPIQAFGRARDELDNVTLTDIGTEVSSRIAAVIEEIRRRAQKFVPLDVITSERRQMLRTLLVEDPTPSEMAYSEYLFQLNRIIQSRIESRV
jgi:hypothetical protein